GVDRGRVLDCLAKAQPSRDAGTYAGRMTSPRHRQPQELRHDGKNAPDAGACLYAALRSARTASPLMKYSRSRPEVDPVSLTPEDLCRRSPRCRAREGSEHHTRLSFGGRWLISCVLVARPRS